MSVAVSVYISVSVSVSVSASVSVPTPRHVVPDAKRLSTHATSDTRHIATHAVSHHMQGRLSAHVTATLTLPLHASSKTHRPLLCEADACNSKIATPRVELQSCIHHRCRHHRSRRLGVGGLAEGLEGFMLCLANFSFGLRFMYSTFDDFEYFRYFKYMYSVCVAYFSATWTA